MKRRYLTGAILLASAPQAHAADVAFDPRIALTGIYSDNYRLEEDRGEQLEVSGVRLDAQVAIRTETPRTLFRLTPRLRLSRFPGDESEDSEDFFIPLRLEHQTARTSSRLNVEYSEVAIRGRYFPEAGVGEDDVLGDPDRGVGIGLASLDDQENRFRIAPEFSFELSERRSIRLSAGYLDVAYDTRVPGDRVDYQDVYGAIAFSQALSPRTNLMFRVGASTYEADGESPRDTQGLDAEWRNTLSESSEVYVRAGVFRAENVSDTNGSSGWDTGFTGGLGVRWAFEVTDIWLEFDQSLDPSSSGSVVSRQQIRAQLRRRLSEMLGFTVGARYIRDSGTNSEVDLRDRDYATAAIGFDWRLNRQWTLVASYDYRWREFEGAPQNAQANSVNFGFVYEPNRR